LEGQSEPASHNEIDMHENNLDTQGEDQELKVQLLRKYSGYLGGLKKEFLKKKKNGKLPKEARQQLLDWWNRHYKWPYPSVTKFYFFHDFIYRSYHAARKFLGTLLDINVHNHIMHQPNLTYKIYILILERFLIYFKNKFNQRSLNVF
jgi:hypothetical protein